MNRGPGANRHVGTPSFIGRGSFLCLQMSRAFVARILETLTGLSLLWVEDVAVRVIFSTVLWLLSFLVS